MKRKKIVFFFYCLALHASLQAAPSNVNPRLLFVTEHSPPFQFFGESNKVEGLTTTIIQEALKLTPYSYQIKIYPWSRAFALAKGKTNTCIFLISRDYDREPHFQWVAPLLLTNDYFIGLADRQDLTIQSLDDVKKHNVAVLKEDRTYYELLNQGFVENKNLFVINNSTSMLRLLTKRTQIDFILADTINVKYRAQYHGMDYQTFKAYFKLNEKPTELHLACSLTTPKAVVDNLAGALQTIKDNGVYHDIVGRWR